MTRDDAMLKLLAIEPATHDQLVLETGWGIDETRAVVRRLRARRAVSYINRGGRQWFCLATARPGAPMGGAPKAAIPTSNSMQPVR